MSVHTHGVRVIRDDLCPAGGGGQPGAGAVQRGGGVGVAARPGQVQRGHAAWPGVISRASNEMHPQYVCTQPNILPDGWKMYFFPL